MKSSVQHEVYAPNPLGVNELEELLRFEVAKHCGAGVVEQEVETPVSAQEESPTDDGNWSSQLLSPEAAALEISLGESERHTSAGAALYEATRFWKPLRPVARAFLYLGRTITNPQKRWNRIVLDTIRTVADSMLGLSRDLNQLQSRLERAEATETELARRLDDLDRSVAETLRGVSAELATLHERARQAEARSAALLAAKHRQAEMYLDFENRFRGDRSLVSQRLQSYLPLLQEAGLGNKDMPILDVGSGRGEWLELIRDQGWVGWGLDSNPILAEECRSRGLTVVEGQALDYLSALPDASLGAVTAIHVVEHLPYRTLLQFLTETARVLKPGGMAIFETPNPENLIVGACDFYIDATHKRPLHPEVLQFLAERSGFARAEVLRLREHRVRDPLPFLDSDHALAGTVNTLIELANARFFAAPDYAVVSRRAG